MSTLLEFKTIANNLYCNFVLNLWIKETIRLFKIYWRLFECAPLPLTLLENLLTILAMDFFKVQNYIYFKEKRSPTFCHQHFYEQ